MPGGWGRGRFWREGSLEFGRGFLAFRGMGAGVPGAMMDRQLRDQPQTRWGWGAGGVP